MKTAALLLVAVLAVSAVFTVIYTCNFFNASNPAAGVDECYFGVTCGFNTTRESETVIDKVKNFTNLIIIDSWDLTQNETVLNEICDYAANAGLKFIVYFDLISGTSPPMPAFYPWHKEWLTTAEDRWGTNFSAFICTMNSAESKSMNNATCRRPPITPMPQTNSSQTSRRWAV